MKRLVALIALMLVVTTPMTAGAEEKFDDLVKRASDLKAQGKFGQALAEMSWAVKQLEDLHGKKLASFLPAKVGELSGGEPQISSAMGLLSIERTYSTPSGAEAKVSLAGASGNEGAASAGMGGLAGIAQMAAAMGNVEGVEMVRIKGQRATIQTDSGEPRLMLSVAGFVVQIEQVGGAVTKEQMIALAEAIDIQALTAYAAG